MQDTILRFRDWDVTIVLSKYADPLGRPAIQLRAADTPHNAEQNIIPGEPIATATINLPDWEAGPDQTYIKDYSENEGILDWLIENNLVTPTGTFVVVGWVDAPLVTLTPHCYDIAGRL